MQTVTQKTLEDTMYYGDIPVFVYKINYPSFTAPTPPPLEPNGASKHKSSQGRYPPCGHTARPRLRAGNRGRRKGISQ